MKNVGLSQLIGMAVLVMAALQTAATAEVLELWPDSFRQDLVPLTGETTSTLVSQNPAAAGARQVINGKHSWIGWAAVKLPAGSVISQISYVHGGGLGGATGCSLYRVKYGKTPKLAASATSISLSSLTVPLTVIDANLLTIKPGFRYYVHLIAEEGTTVRGVRITY